MFLNHLYNQRCVDSLGKKKKALLNVNVCVSLKCNMQYTVYTVCLYCIYNHSMQNSTKQYTVYYVSTQCVFHD